MRSLFRGYYPPTDAELGEMWAAGSIILDTNALLNLYRYTGTTRDDFFSVLDELKGRLWIPAQVGQEFQVRRMAVIDEQRAAFTLIRSEFESTRESLKASIAQFKRHSSIDIATLTEVYGTAVDGILRDLTAQEEAHSKAFGRGYPTDSIWDRLTELLEGKVGPGFTSEELSATYIEGSTRYASEIPPGYKDKSKGEPSMYGDLVIWKEILRRAANSEDTAIFVTDDGKEDWWRIFKGEKLGPRPELVDEYFAAANKRIHFYSPEQFLRHAKGRVNARVSEESLGEVQRVSTQATDRIRAVAEERLRELQDQRDHLIRMAERRSPAAGSAQGELRHRLLEAHTEASAELAHLEGAQKEARMRVVQEADIPDRHRIHLELEGLDEISGSLRSRIADIERRLRQMDRPARPSSESYRFRAEQLDEQISDIAQALADADDGNRSE